MKKNTSIDVALLLALAGQLTIDLERVIDFHNQQLRILKEKIDKMPRLSNLQRVRLAAHYNTIEKRLRVAQETIVTPRTLMRWHQRLIKEKWDYSQRSKQKRGRPQTAQDKMKMVIRMAKENQQLGYLDIANRMKNIGWEISYQTVRTILLSNGIEPAKQRSKRLGWKAFLERNWDSLYALDFTTVESNDNGYLNTHYLLFVIKISTREARFAGRTRHPVKAWVQQQIRNLSDPFDGFLKECTHIIMDNDSQLHPSVVKPLVDNGINIIRTPIKAPNCNTYIERFIQSFKREALSFVIPRSGGQIDEITRNYMIFYNQERNHQGLKGEIIHPKESIGNDIGDIKTRVRNTGSLKYYYRSAA